MDFPKGTGKSLSPKRCWDNYISSPVFLSGERSALAFWLKNESVASGQDTTGKSQYCKIKFFKKWRKITSHFNAVDKKLHEDDPEAQGRFFTFKSTQKVFVLFIKYVL